MKVISIAVFILMSIFSFAQSITGVTLPGNPVECQSWDLVVSGDKPMPQYFVASENFSVSGSVITVTINWDAPPFGNPTIAPYSHTVTIPAQTFQSGNYTLVVENYYVATGQITGTHTSNSFTIGTCCPATADFTISANELCWDDTLFVVDNGSGIGTTEWYLNGTLHHTGSGDFSLYGLQGNYDLKCIATDGTCVDSMEYSIDYYYRPITDFSYTFNGSMYMFTAFTSSSNTIDWDFGDGNTGYGALENHIYQSAGQYEVCLTVTSSFGCVADSCITINFSPFGTVENEKKITIYPNPTTEVLYMESPSEVTHQWTNLTGQSIEVPYTFDGSKMIWDTSKLNSGIYFIRFDNAFQKVIIETKP